MSEYYYLVSSLPLLNPDTPPLMDSEEFLDSCGDFLSDSDIDKLNSLSLIPGEHEMYNKTLDSWFSWETKLRNTILLQRKKGDIENPEKYLREEDDFFLEIQKGVQDAFTRSPGEREESLDKIRWAKLEDLELGHDFDFTKLCLYKLQLLLCEKRKEREIEKGSANYDQIVSEIYGIDPLAPPQIEENVEDN